MSPEFSPLSSGLGGALIGLAASAMLLLEGRIAGISGIVGGLFPPTAGDTRWRLALLAGLLTAGIGAAWFVPDRLEVGIARSPGIILLSGLLVGFGTRLGNGCTSGHGVCGLSRLSARSLASVATFMTVGMVVAVIVGRLTGGGR